MKLHDEGETFESIAKKLKIGIPSVRTHFYAAKKREETNAEIINAIGPESELPPNAAELADLCDKKSHRILKMIDDDKIAKAPLNQQAYAFATFVDKARLLRGEATSIVSVEDRRQLKDLLPFLVMEAKRRGMMDESGLIIEGECAPAE